MALNGYLNLTGETQGAINGSCDQAGREDKIEVYGWSHEVISPRDAASGLPTGKRQHKPFNVTHCVDKASPLLMTVLTTNENISEWRLECWMPNASGDEVQFFTVELINANIAGIRMEQLNNKYAENMQHEVREHVAFTYQKIMWTYNEAGGGSIQSEDDWKAPRGA
jgi:type VI secretion system secreted protein Hcp